MADALPMAQIPNPSPVSVSAPQYQNPGMALQSGINAGVNNYAQIAAIQQQQQQIQMAKQQQTIQQVDTLLKSGMNYPGMLPTFWPAIATRMNSLSPDYKLDPNNPPENLPNFAKSLSSISDGLQDGAVSPPQAHAATQQLIQSSFPPKVPPDVGQTTGQSGPQSAAPMQAPQGQPQQGPPQGVPPQQGQPPPQDPLTNFAAIKAQYDKANQLISQAPMEGPQSQENLRKQLESSSLGLNYKKALDQLATTANAQYGAGQEMDRAKMAQDQDAVRSLTSSFESQSQDAKNVFDNLNVFNSMMNQSRQFQGAKDTTGAVNAEKASLLAFAQMAYPGTGRPGNQEMLENMEKSGPYGTLISQALNKVGKGEIMTDSQIKGLRQAAVGIAQSREQSQTDQENTTASAIQMHGANPSGFLRNYRPSSLASTSKVFPSQPSKNPLIGQVVKGYKFLGGNASDQDNWVQADE
jgi:hypothetical protein